MGFGWQLEHEVIEEWRSAYIDYPRLKQLIEDARQPEQYDTVHAGAEPSSQSLVAGRRADSRDSSTTITGGNGRAGQRSTADNSQDAATKAVLRCLDQQLKDVEDFYQDLLKQAQSRYKLLDEQMVDLAEHRDEWLHAYQNVPMLVQPFLTVLRHLKERVMPETEEGAEQHKVFESSHYKREPHRFGAARRKLELALCEYYVYLGSVNNYCAINKAGFDKCAKKIELELGAEDCRATYRDKVNKKEFSHAYAISNLQTKTEVLYADNFESHHSPKKAAHRLRALTRPSSAHSLATARAGIFLGMAVVIGVLGLLNATSKSTFHRLPQRSPLLQIYAAFLLPVVLALSVGLDLVAWSRARIDIPVVFSFDRRTHIHRHSFFEIPAFLLLTLAICFYASFRIHHHIVPPQIWPLVWLFSTLLFLINPFPIFHFDARWWLIRSTFRVLASGLIEVEFRDFFLGDQLCSLYYSIYNLYTIGCVYHHNFAPNVSSTCSTNSTWVTPFLASLPFAFRVGHSIRRYTSDPGTKTHLLNVLKYALSIVYQFIYYNWRISGSPKGVKFALFIAAATINASASHLWDVKVDWDLMQRSARYPFLRDQLSFSNHRWVYYVAIVANLPLRFAWMIYLLEAPNSSLQGFINSSLEVLRRCMWNLFRVEAEHLGNVDDFRAVRDAPLPYEKTEFPKTAKRSDPLDVTRGQPSGGRISPTSDDGRDTNERTPLRNSAQHPYGLRRDPKQSYGAV